MEKQMMHPLWPLAAEDEVEAIKRMEMIALDHPLSRLYKKVLVDVIYRRFNGMGLSQLRKLSYHVGTCNIPWETYAENVEVLGSGWSESLLSRLTRCHDSQYAVTQLLINHGDELLDYEDGELANATFANVMFIIANYG